MMKVLGSVIIHLTTQREWGNIASLPANDFLSFQERVP